MAKIDFPNPTDSNPATGTNYGSGWYNPANGVTYVYSNNTWSAATVANSDFDSRYVEVGGDTMTGGLRLPGGGGDADALQKQEIEALITTLDNGLDGRYVEVSGDHMSGPLTIGPDTDPTNAVVNIGSTALGDGDIQVGGDALANAGVNIYKTGTIVSTAASNTEIFRGYFPGLSEPDTVSITSTGNAVFAGDVQMASQNGGQLAGFRNQVINGGMDVAQRGSDFNPPADNSYTLDRWAVSDGSGRVMQFLDAPPGFTYSVRLSGGTKQFLLQGIELPRTGSAGPFSVASTWTFSCYLKGSTADTIDLEIGFRDQNTSGINSISVATTSFNYTTDWHRYDFTFTIANSPNASNTCLSLILNAVPAPSNQVFITGVQLEPGPVATPFEHRPIGTELALCQRYFIQSIGSTPYIYNMRGGGNVDRNFEINLPVYMRVAPTTITTEVDSDFTIGSTNQTVYGNKNNTDPTTPAAIANITLDAEL